MSRRCEIVVIGASTGALNALSQILSALPAGFPAPILVVVHLPGGKDNLMVELMASRCALPVREAEDKEPMEAGMIYFAPPEYHLLVEPDRRMSLSVEEPVNYSRPSIDPLFESAADVFGEGTIGLILTGASRDGAAGLRAVEDAGGIALVQSPGTAEATVMPLAALEHCSNARSLPLEQIASTLVEVTFP